MLFLIATPIGHLDDLSKRAHLILSEVDAIFCEDTRHSKVLLDHYNIKRPLYSYHKFNEKKREETLLTLLREGKQIALISDAGTPCLADPGAVLIRACIREKIPFTAIPGPCSVIQALLLSGFAEERFQFVGFLPKNKQKALRQFLLYPGVTIAFESPKRLLNTLEAIAVIDPHRKLAIVREMTKKFEECMRGTSADLASHFRTRAARGEIVLCIAPKTAENPLLQEELTIEECVEMLCTFHELSQKEAIKTAASLLHKSKKEVYKHILEK